MKKISFSKDNVILYLYIFGLIVLDNGTFLMKIIKISLILWTIMSLCYRKRFYCDKYIVWNLIFLAFFGLSILWSLYPSVTFAAIKTSLLNTACVISIFQLCNKRDNLNIVFQTIRVIPYFSIIFFIRVICQYGGIALSGVRQIDEAATSLHNSLGMFCAFSGVIAIFLATMLKKNRIKYYIILIINFIILLLSGSRKSLLYFIIPIIIFGIFNSKNPLKSFRNLILILGGMFLLNYLIMNNAVLYSSIGNGIETLVQGLLGNETDESTSGRLRIINWGIGIFKENKIYGIGLESFKMMHESYFGNLAIADNNYIELLVDLGIIGLLIYYSFHAYLVFVLTKQIKKKSRIVYILIGIEAAILICDFGCSSYKNVNQCGEMPCLLKGDYC